MSPFKVLNEIICATSITDTVGYSVSYERLVSFKNKTVNSKFSYLLDEQVRYSLENFSTCYIDKMKILLQRGRDDLARDNLFKFLF